MAASNRTGGWLCDDSPDAADSDTGADSLAEALTTLVLPTVEVRIALASTRSTRGSMSESSCAWSTGDCAAAATLSGSSSSTTLLDVLLPINYWLLLLNSTGSSCVGITNSKLCTDKTQIRVGLHFSDMRISTFGDKISEWGKQVALVQSTQLSPASRLPSFMPTYL